MHAYAHTYTQSADQRYEKRNVVNHSEVNRTSKALAALSAQIT